MFAIQELRTSFVNGNYLATVLVAQVFAEHALAHPFIMAGEDAIATTGFAKLVDESAARGWLPAGLQASLHELRRMRNPYTHPSPLMSARSYMSRLRDSGTWDPHSLARRDAVRAIQIVVDFLRDGSPEWGADGGADEDWWRVYEENGSSGGGSDSG